MSANSKVRHTLNLSAARVGQIRDLFEVPPTRPVEVGIYVILVDSPWPLCPWGGKVLDGISTPLSSNMTLQSVEQTDKETTSFLVSLSLGPLVHFPVKWRRHLVYFQGGCVAKAICFRFWWTGSNISRL